MTARKAAAVTETAAPTATAIPDTLTADDYIARLNAMLEVGRNIARHAGWCGEWYSYLNAISRSFPRSSDGTVTDVTVAGPELPREWFTDEGWTEYTDRAGRDRSHELHNIRGRILHWVNSGNLSLADANNTFRAGGIPEWGSDGTNVIYLAYFPAVYVRGNVDPATATDTLTTAFRQFMTEHGNEPTSAESGGTHSSDLTVDLDRHGRRSGVPIPEGDIVPLLHRDR